MAEVCGRNGRLLYEGIFGETASFCTARGNPQRFQQSVSSIAQECQVPEYCNDPKADVLKLIKEWLEKKSQRPWLMIIDNADDTELFFSSEQQEQEKTHQHTSTSTFGRYIPDCAQGSILITTRNKGAAVKLTRNRGVEVVEIGQMDGEEATKLLRARLGNVTLADDHVPTLCSLLENLPLTLVQAAVFIQANSVTVKKYLYLLKQDDTTVDLLSKEFEATGRDSGTPRSVAATWMISFRQIERPNSIASEFLSLMSYFDWQGIPKAFISEYNDQRQHKYVDTKEQRADQRNRELRLEEALGVLKAFSFISETPNEHLHMHRLVQLVMRKWLVMNDKSRQFVGGGVLDRIKPLPVRQALGSEIVR
ncbi:MAG: hypothetical protein Q9211_002858 [Gyalolechia sp. 1 TL-2023]